MTVTNLLIQNLKYNNVNTTVINWITSFLSVRKHRVKLNFFSEQSGIPQETILGPVLFFRPNGGFVLIILVLLNHII